MPDLAFHHADVFREGILEYRIGLAVALFKCNGAAYLRSVLLRDTDITANVTRLRRERICRPYDPVGILQPRDLSGNPFPRSQPEPCRAHF